MDHNDICCVGFFLVKAAVIQVMMVTLKPGVGKYFKEIFKISPRPEDNTANAKRKQIFWARIIFSEKIYRQKFSISFKNLTNYR